MSVNSHDTVSERLRRLIRNQLLSNSQVRVLSVSCFFFCSFRGLHGSHRRGRCFPSLSPTAVPPLVYPSHCMGATRTCPPSPKSQIIRFSLDPLLVDLVLGANFGFGPQFQRSNSLSCPGLTRNSPLYSFC